jgi:hypothetical protein
VGINIAAESPNITMNEIDLTEVLTRVPFHKMKSTVADIQPQHRSIN